MAVSLVGARRGVAACYALVIAVAETGNKTQLLMLFFVALILPTLAGFSREFLGAVGRLYKSCARGSVLALYPNRINGNTDRGGCKRCGVRFFLWAEIGL